MTANSARRFYTPTDYSLWEKLRNNVSTFVKVKIQKLSLSDRGKLHRLMQP
ncbi:hypothetical protein [Oscillatoria salina]|uniref:hypothetical protein n=1 Tax=Oscillatoria salina TaxID=331517 RepID=UPI0013BC2561|nr:hypothetical protein [Oscillatoria salina]MBZ8183093.1 hypothetical protein [Oscillatoria salina IIICB1]NET91623.1 hypothetical protein [Kamptonema sp. SIO1D9]